MSTQAELWRRQMMGDWAASNDRLMPGSIDRVLASVYEEWRRQRWLSDYWRLEVFYRPNEATVVLQLLSPTHQVSIDIPERTLMSANSAEHQYQQALEMMTNRVLRMERDEMERTMVVTDAAGQRVEMKPKPVVVPKPAGPVKTRKIRV